MDFLNSAVKEIETIKEQIQNFESNTQNIIDETLANLQKTKKFIDENGSVSLSKFLLTEYLNLLKEALSKCSNEHKDIHSYISRFGRMIDKNMVTNYQDGALDPDFEREENTKILNEVICEHFLRYGLCSLSDTFIKESGIVMDQQSKEPFIEINYVLESLKAKNLQPALKWIANNHEKLLQTDSKDLEFKLYKLNFLQILLQSQNLQDSNNANTSPSSSNHEDLGQIKYAISYASQKLTPFATTHTKEFQKLMGLLLYARNYTSRPTDLIANNSINDEHMKNLKSQYELAWEEIEELFVQDSCNLLGLSTESPLAVSFVCGIKAYPAILNIRQMMQQRQVAGVWSSHVKDELPVEVDLGPDYRFHSIFACPILRQQSNASNPPMRLKCGHVISKEALNKLASVSKIKCPYCPEEVAVADAKQIFF